MRGALYPSRPGSRRIESNRSVAKPGLNASRALARLRTNRPPATSTTTEIDSCATTSALRSVSRRAPWLLPLSPGLSDGTRSVRTACQAGASPKTRPVASDSASPQPSTRRSGVKSSVMGSWTLAGIAAPEQIGRPECQRDGQRSRDEPQRRAFGQQLPHHSPASRTQGRRIAISRRRAVALARNRLATLPHAMSQTSPDAHSASVEIAADLFESALMSRLQFRDDVDLGRRQLVGLRQSRGNRRELRPTPPRR